MKIAIVGAGAIGGFIAAALARSGADVCVVARGQHLEAIAKHGITLVRSDLGPFTARVKAAADLRELPRPDIAILTFKAHQWPELIAQLAPLAGTATRVVTLQNGVPFWLVRDQPLRSVDPGGRIAALFDDDHVVGGVVNVSGHIVDPGRIHQSGGTRYVLGGPRGGSSNAVDALAAVMRTAELKAEVDPNVRATLWLKLVNNVGLNAVSALNNVTIRPMLESPPLREAVRTLMNEALAVGRRLGVVGDVDLDSRLAYAERLGDVRTSMLQDRLAGRPLELDPIHGAVVELGERLGVDVSHVREAYDKLRALASPSP
jgi:2-dehydropantoate 2-reductase